MKRVIRGLKKNVANKKIHHTGAKRMIDNLVIVGRVDLPNKNSSW